MRQQQDKEFDSRLSEKMRDFSAMPPASLWENIDREINSPAVPPEKASMGWLKIAASVCLLATAGFWLLQYRGPFEKDMLSINAEQDSVSETHDSGVRVFNNSRRRDAARSSGETAASGSEEASGEAEAPGRLEASGKLEASGGKPAPGTKAPATQPRQAPAKDTAPVSVPGAAPAEEDRMQAIDTDVSRIADLGKPAGVNPELTASIAAAPADAGETGSYAFSAGNEDGQEEKRASFFPKKIMEVSGVDKALNVVTAAIDRSEDNVISVAKNETSGKWNSVRLNLGLVTISYNKPAKKTDSDKN